MLLVAAHENISLFVVALIVSVFFCIYLPQKDTIHFLNSLESLVMLAPLWG